MRIVVTAALIILLLSFDSFGQDRSKSYWQHKREQLEQIYRTQPRRLDGPLREDNISDDEVREIQAVGNVEFPGELVNISGVTSGCPCEDGPDCDSQVWVVAYREGRNDSLLLSRIDESWAIGPVQRWWREYDDLRALMREALSTREPDRFARYRDLQEQQNELVVNFPLCAIGN